MRSEKIWKPVIVRRKKDFGVLHALMRMLKYWKKKKQNQYIFKSNNIKRHAFIYIFSFEKAHSNVQLTNRVF